MKRNSNFSGILELSSIAQTVDSLQKVPNLTKTLSGNISNLSSIDEFSSFMKNLHSNLEHLYGSESIATLNKQISAVSNVDFNSIATGIKVYGNTVKLSPSAKIALDSLNTQLYKKEPHFKRNTKNDKSPNTKPIAVVKVHSKTSTPKTISQKFVMKKAEFDKLYLPSIQYFMEQIGFPILVTLLTTNPASLSPLIDVVSKFHESYVQIKQQELEEEKMQTELMREIKDLLQTNFNQHQPESACIEEEPYSPPNIGSPLPESHDIETPLSKFLEPTPETVVLPNANNSN